MTAVGAMCNEHLEAIIAKDKVQNVLISIAVDANFKPGLKFLIKACPKTILIFSNHNSLPIK